MFWPRDFLEIIFPEHCLLCGCLLSSPEQNVICLSCESRLPPTGGSDEHPLYQLFFNPEELRSGISLYEFEKGSAIQKLMHALKYGGRPGAGVFLGRLLGYKLVQVFEELPEVILPVPLHPSRLQKRGYNQSEVIARGVSGITGIPVNNGILTRVRFRGSQTRKGREERFQNMNRSFSLGSQATRYNFRSVLLVDDIVTTGATLEACVQLLLQQYHCTVSVASLSVA